MKTSASDYGADTFAATLFAYAGIALGSHSRHTDPLQIQRYIAATQRRLILLNDGGRKDYSPINPSFTQLSLPLMVSARPTVVRMALRRRYAYFDYGVFDVFRDVPLAAKPALRLEAKGVAMLGQLVQLSEDDVRIIASTDEKAIDAMKRQLALVDLGFDMRIPDWNRDYDRYRAGVPYSRGPSLS